MASPYENPLSGPYTADDEIEFDMVTGQPTKKKKAVPTTVAAGAVSPTTRGVETIGKAVVPGAVGAIQKRKAMLDGL